MYHIALYEEGWFRTYIGGPVKTLAEVKKQIEIIGPALKGSVMQGKDSGFGYLVGKCYITITDNFGTPFAYAEWEEV